MTLSSANRAWSASASTSECTATVRIPNSLRVRMIRTAISPRLAIRILSNIGGQSFFLIDGTSGANAPLASLWPQRGGQLAGACIDERAHDFSGFSGIDHLLDTECFGGLPRITEREHPFLDLQSVSLRVVRGRNLAAEGGLHAALY